jgi:stage II sporulation protein E
VLGEERLHFIIAGADRDGSIITSPELHRGIEDALGIRLGECEYYRRGDLALLECSAAEKYSVDFFAVGKGKAGESVSGDAVASILDEGGRFSAMIADGMGAGEDAHSASQLASELLSDFLRAGARRQTALHVTNHLLKSRCIECSTTVDLFDFDLVTGEAVFYKCGAAPSFVKRGDSIFRIKSETAPIGIAAAIDAERVRVEVEPGDLVIMISDGIPTGLEDGAWLPKLLSKPTLSGAREYAEAILKEAECRTPFTDDVTVAVARIKLKRES